MSTYLCAQVKWIIEMKFKQLVGVVLEPEGVRWRAQWGTCTESCAFLPHGRINFLSMGPSINPYILVKLGPCPCITTESYYDWILKHETRYINTRSHSILQIKGQVFYPKTWYTTGFTNIKFCYPSECICLKKMKQRLLAHDSEHTTLECSWTYQKETSMQEDWTKGFYLGDKVSNQMHRYIKESWQECISTY